MKRLFYVSLFLIGSLLVGCESPTSPAPPPPEPEPQKEIYKGYGTVTIGATIVNSESVFNFCNSYFTGCRTPMDAGYGENDYVYFEAEIFDSGGTFDGKISYYGRLLFIRYTIDGK